MDGVLERIKDAVYALTGACCAGESTLKLNGRSFKIVKLLGEGGFSYVYLAQDVQSGRLFALKKIRCPLGSDSVREALREVEAYRKFRHKNIIRCLDSCVVQDAQEGTKVIYLFLPYYERATVQDAINAHSVNGTHYSESDALRLFLGTCEAVRAMHEYRSGPSVAYPPASTSSELQQRQSVDDDDDDEDDKIITRGEGEGERLIGSLEANLSTVAREQGDAPGMDNDEDGVVLGRLKAPSQQHLPTQQQGEVTPWAHRDIKPANVMIADDGSPVLMDFGSAMPARIAITNRQIALQQQDLAAEHSSMPYRAPELFDVKTDTTLTEAVDVWSLGCTLYAMAYGYSPFETSQQSEHGGSIAMAVLSGKYAFPRNDRMSEGYKGIIDGCLQVDPDKRWTIARVIDETRRVLDRLS